MSSIGKTAAGAPFRASKHPSRTTTPQSLSRANETLATTRRFLNRNTIEARLKRARVARLATADSKGRPHIVPICFVYDGRALYTPLDLKPKRTAPEKLARVRHILAQPHVAVLIDEYQEDWSRLWYILVRGHASLVEPSEGSKHSRALGLLQKKYPQYTARLLPERAALIRIRPSKIIAWESSPC
jgi:PPOX class probable F420-dependent enzyme